MTKFGYLRSRSDYFNYKTIRDDVAHMRALGEVGAEENYESSGDEDGDKNV